MNRNLSADYPVFEFHVARNIREKYSLDESFFSLNGHVVFANFYQVRLFTQRINEKRHPSEHVSPGEVNGAGLLDEIYHIAIRNYIRSSFPNAFPDAISDIKEKLGIENLDSLLLEFIKVFPPLKVFKNELTPIEYLNSSTDMINNREILVEELILLHFANRNPAFNKIKELFDENYLEGKKVYRNTISVLRQFFKKEEFRIGISNTDLFDFLSMPFIKYSHSIWDQLEFIKNEWGIFIDHKLLQKIQSSKDLFTENIKFEPHFGGGGAAPTIVPQYKGRLIDAEDLVIGKSRFRYADDSPKDYDEPEQFTPDTNWMPNLILIAKNTYVWLDQLSKKYSREIRRLDQIPVEELQLLRSWNINGLWLIGVWERSSASKRIKHLMGNIDAVSSAYSLYDYKIAADLGGEEAYNVFNKRAMDAGIRLASDMVPNHTGIYSDWVLNRPDYFIQLGHPPFPNYRFTGENLSETPGIEIRIEDQYWQMKDAAVVFERKDLNSGNTAYIYHGNDGTNMPWNDTAQLNLLKQEVREALIQKIFDVARKFSVIRFDAAMTLAKKHYARLWYPEPGKGGDIPSRADFALTRRQFDELFPKEFWREVVDRINQEMPDTLLLAEAFWLMEGYFVRTLGMHRVYNSAFMNMLMNEENAKYRELITNTLEFEPEILKRYVNFMSNPDEETAIDQFGSGDKYFGVLVLMTTLPGLPMFAHGQIEGYTEKYGMEYKRAYYNEKPLDWLVERHEREIFPLMNKRYIFSEVKNFWLYDFLTDSGTINENVYVYTNKFGGEKGLVIYNNSYESTSGSFFFSRQKLNGNSSNPSSLINTKIASDLDLGNSDFHFYILRDATTGLEYIVNGREVHTNGFYTVLSGYEYRVFLHIEELFDPSGEVYKFYKTNSGKGTYNIRRELEKLKLAPLHRSFTEHFSKLKINKFFVLMEKVKEDTKDFEIELISGLENLINEFSERAILSKNTPSVKKSILRQYPIIIQRKRDLQKLLKNGKSKSDKKIYEFCKENYRDLNLVILIYSSVARMKDLFENDEIADNYISEFMLTKPIKSILRDNMETPDNLASELLLMNILLRIDDKVGRFKEIPEEMLKLRSGKKILEFFVSNNSEFIEQLLKDELATTYLNVNTFEGETYFSKERFEDLLNLLLYWFAFQLDNSEDPDKRSNSVKEKEIIRFVKKLFSVKEYLEKRANDIKYHYDKLYDLFSPPVKKKK